MSRAGRDAGIAVEWGDLLRDLDRLQEATIEKDGKRITPRTAVTGQVGSVFRAAGVALPRTRANIRPDHQTPKMSCQQPAGPAYHAVLKRTFRTHC